MLQTPLLAASLPGRNLFLNVDFLLVRASLPGFPASATGTAGKGSEPGISETAPVQQLSPGFGLAKQNRPALEPVRLLAGWAYC